MFVGRQKSDTAVGLGSPAPPLGKKAVCPQCRLAKLAKSAKISALFI